MDNDGLPDQVQVWEGRALPSNGGTGRCGEMSYAGGFDGEPTRQPQTPFVLTGIPSRLDVSKTEAIFGHPLKVFRFYDQVEKKWIHARDFRPIGRTISLFEYKHAYYFDTFFDNFGDFPGKRRKDPHIYDTLGVFLHRDGKTRQVCEYRMMQLKQ